MPSIIYIRTSTKEQTPELQLADIRKLLRPDDVPEIMSEKQSAWSDTKERLVFSNLTARIKARQVTDLYVWDLDRLYRNYKKLSQFFELCKVFGCKVHSFRQSWIEQLHSVPYPWNEIVHELVIKIYGHIGEDESNKKSMRVRNAVRKETGQTFSYKGKKWGRKSLPDKVIKTILEANATGLSIRKIAETVQYWDENNNRKTVSVGAVHKIIARKQASNAQEVIS